MYSKKKKKSIINFVCDAKRNLYKVKVKCSKTQLIVKRNNWIILVYIDIKNYRTPFYIILFQWQRAILH